MQLSIIIVNYNVEHYLELCLDSVFAAIEALDAEVIVVDNDSRDGSAGMVARRFPEVHFVANKENVGFSKANNQGVQLAKGEYLCILNPDTVVAEDTFKSIYAFYKHNEIEAYKWNNLGSQSKGSQGAIGIRLVDGSGKYLPESKRNLPTPKVSLDKMMGNGAAYYANHLQEYETGKIDVLVGAFMFVKKSIYKEVGGFDERYFMYGEDIDLSYTITQAGYVNYYVGEQAIIHFKGESTIKDKTYRERFYGAMRLFYEKHLRKNALENTLVQLGLKGAKIRAALSKESLDLTLGDTLPQVARYYIMTDSEDVYHAFAKAVTAKVYKKEANTSLERGCELVFDAASIQYRDIIKQIISLQDQGVTFKIIPKNSTFALGSNSSSGKGDLISFAKE